MGVLGISRPTWFPGDPGSPHSYNVLDLPTLVSSKVSGRVSVGGVSVSVSVLCVLLRTSIGMSR